MSVAAAREKAVHSVSRSQKVSKGAWLSTDPKESSACTPFHSRCMHSVPFAMHAARVPVCAPQPASRVGRHSQRPALRAMPHAVALDTNSRWQQSVAVWHPHGVAHAVLVQHIVEQEEPDLVDGGVAPVRTLVWPMVVPKRQRHVPAGQTGHRVGVRVEVEHAGSWTGGWAGRAGSRMVATRPCRIVGGQSFPVLHSRSALSHW